MGAFLGISLWVALATVVPGLITIAAIYLAVLTISPDLLNSYSDQLKNLNDWVGSGIAVTIMVLTQAFGILLENILVSKKWLGSESREITIAKGIDPHGKIRFTLQPYFEYQGLYVLLSELRDDEDAQGHLKRVLSQYFLTNNSLVSFLVGMFFGILTFAHNPSVNSFIRTFKFLSFVSLFLFISYKVALIRFEVMAKALWAARRRRLQFAED